MLSACISFDLLSGSGKDEKEGREGDACFVLGADDDIPYSRCHCLSRQKLKVINNNHVMSFHACHTLGSGGSTLCFEFFIF